MYRIIFILFLLSQFTVNGNCQSYTFKASSPVVEQTMYKAVSNAERFILHVLPDSVYKRHFKLQVSLSEVDSDYSSHHYQVYFSDSIDFTPNKYELRYLITIKDDTLTDSFVIPVDRLGNTNIDTTNFHYIYDDLKAYRRLFTGQFKFDYSDVKAFIKSKRLKEYSIMLQNSGELIQQKQYQLMKHHKHYWFVYRYFPGYEIIYRIDPDTGRYTKNVNKVRVES